MFKVALSSYSIPQKLAPGDPRWAQFNSCFRNVELPQQRIINQIYSGAAITTWHKNNWRSNANFICGQHMGLDFDNGDQSSSIAALRGDKFIGKYASFLYTTMSHTPEEPRSRVIFLLDQPIMQAANYAKAAAALLWVFGGADRQCKDPARFFYGSPDCEVEILSNVLPLDVVKKLIAAYEESGEREKRKRTAPEYRAPAEMADVQAALAMIDPWSVTYTEWVEILMAIHHEFGDGGLALAENWGDGYQQEVERKWRSFKKGGNTSGAVTIGTVFALAKERGWRRNGIAA